MSSLLIEDLSKVDTFLSLNKNEMEYIYGGDCVSVGTVTASDGKKYEILLCEIPS
jgi:hypothetical protein